MPEQAEPQQLPDGAASRVEALPREVAQRLGLKYAAKVKFVPDESFDVASRIDSLLADPRVRRDLDSGGADD